MLRFSNKLMNKNILKQYFGTRKEKDSVGYIEVPEDRLWGAQTQRSLENFKIGKEKMPHGNTIKNIKKNQTHNQKN